MEGCICNGSHQHESLHSTRRHTFVGHTIVDFLRVNTFSLVPTMAFHFITVIIIIMPSVLRLILRASLKAEVLVAKVGKKFGCERNFEQINFALLCERDLWAVCGVMVVRGVVLLMLRKSQAALCSQDFREQVYSRLKMGKSRNLCCLPDWGWQTNDRHAHHFRI